MPPRAKNSVNSNMVPSRDSPYVRVLIYAVPVQIDSYRILSDFQRFELAREPGRQRIETREGDPTLVNSTNGTEAKEFFEMHVDE
ncbi:hypothetical protein RUM43_001893 [Polyplax serrata]|uniref:Uncharacterized protein n=1 Tax=Polyplax serrata TaxID=468196 RepID=A0AAN8SEI1_POLSC